MRTERVEAENGSPEEHPMRKVLGWLRNGGGRAWREERQRLEREGREIVLCPPDCSAKLRADTPHAHTWWDMWTMRGMAEYECELRRALAESQTAKPDIMGKLAAAGVGRTHLDRLREKMDERASFRAARRWWDQPRPMISPDQYGNPARRGPMSFPWLLLLGATDSGKTQAAAWCLQQHFRAWPWNGQASGPRQPPPGLFFTAAELLTLHAAGSDGIQGRDRLDDLRRTPLLVVDDLGATPLTEYALGLLYDILDTRYRERRRTVLTANLSPRDFEQRFDLRGGQRDGASNEGRLYRRASEHGYMAHLTKTGGKLFVGGREQTAKAT
jgi:hypothetical protein